MKFYGVTLAELARITEGVSLTRYQGNLTLGLDTGETATRDSPRVRARLACRDSRGPGARRNASSGTRSVNACWHAHADVLAAMFGRHPGARVTTALADYRGLASFERDFPATASHTMGSLASPLPLAKLCECETGPLPRRTPPCGTAPYMLPRLSIRADVGTHRSPLPASTEPWEADGDAARWHPALLDA